MHAAGSLGVANRVVPHLQKGASGNTEVLAGHPDARLVVNATGFDPGLALAFCSVGQYPSDSDSSPARNHSRK